MFHWRFPLESQSDVSCEPLAVHKQPGEPLRWFRWALTQSCGTGALVNQALSTVLGAGSPIPAGCWSDTHRQLLSVPRAEVVFAGLCLPVGAAAQLWDGLCVFGKSFPTAQPLSCAFDSAAVEVLNHLSSSVERWDTGPGWAGHFGVSPCTLRGPGGEGSEGRAGHTAWGSHSTFILHSWVLTQLHPTSL